MRRNRKAWLQDDFLELCLRIPRWKAPKAVIDGERAKLSKYIETRETLKAAIAKLG